MNKNLKKCIALIVLLLLVVVTIIMFFTDENRSGLPSYRLEILETSFDDNKTRTDYVDSKGTVTYATDKQFATIIRTYNDSYVIKEEFFDENGKPAIQRLGQYGVSHKYNELGQRITYEYLDKSGTPMINRDGYYSIYSTYNDKGLLGNDTYYDINLNQVENNGGFWQYHRYYNDNNKLGSVLFLDKNGSPTMTNKGYARINYEYDESRNARYEYYFDEGNEHCKSDEGCFGRLIVYDSYGNISSITFLGEDGSIINVYGYATVTYTYTNEGYIDVIRYYDENGNMATGGRGQYGIKNIRGRHVYLDSQGKILLRLDNFLNIYPVYILIIGVLLAFIAIHLRKKYKIFFIVIYMIFILMMTLLYRETTGVHHKQVELLISYRKAVYDVNILREILENIWLFVPLGASVYYPPQNITIIGAIFFSVAIEAFQYVSGLGMCSADDIISNSIGIIIGWALATAFHSSSNSSLLDFANRNEVE